MISRGSFHPEVVIYGGFRMVLRFAWSNCDAVSVGQGLFFIKSTSVCDALREAHVLRQIRQSRQCVGLTKRATLSFQSLLMEGLCSQPPPVSVTLVVYSCRHCGRDGRVSVVSWWYYLQVPPVVPVSSLAVQSPAHKLQVPQLNPSKPSMTLFLFT